ncbi:MAG: 16S rRNA (cytosine(1402)-N(4))-methyltransferase RsmH [Bdellovibrionales bacterium]|nr:16S rRNA (cytosine(1402)-N(4))-methyltransferase RsmH [Bdellovibrionales bacterium]
MATEHVPILLNEILEHLKSMSFEPCQMLDGTFGRGGHSSAILKEFSGLKIDAFDRDQQAIDYANEHFNEYIENQRLRLFHGTFHEFENFVGESKYDVILLDLGVSSPQLDQAERGFSFYGDGPLDMRMDQSQGITAADILNEWDEEDLIELFKKYGEIRSPYRVVRAVVHDRKSEPYTTTRSFASLIERVEGWRKKGTHPATQYFLALRIGVNDEIGPLESVIEKMVNHLNQNGEMYVITFHSIEDRIVKWTFKNLSSLGKPKYKKVIVPSDEEMSANPRSRSAKLRIFERSLNA